MPRSRSAWLANLFTTDTTRCQHDAIATFATLAELALKLRQDGVAHSGISDTVATRHDELIKLLPEAPVAVVRRPIKEVFDSLQKYFPRPMEAEILEANLADIEQSLDRLTQRKGTFSMDWTELGDPIRVEALWNHCLRGSIPFVADRYNFLKDMRVEAIFERAVKGYHKDLRNYCEELFF